MLLFAFSAEASFSETWNEHRFRTKTREALVRVKNILDTNKEPTNAEEVPHVYDDKYALANYLTNTALAADLNILKEFGMGDQILETLNTKAAKNNRTILLSFEADERCEFIEEKEFYVDGKTKVVSSGFFGSSETKTMHKEKQWIWNYTVSYKIKIGVDDYKVSLREGRTSKRLIQHSKAAPHKDYVAHPETTVDVTFLITSLANMATGKDRGRFAIDRSDKSCLTPRRNKDVQDVLDQFRRLHVFNARVEQYMLQMFLPTGLPNMESNTRVNEVFCPVAAFFDRSTNTTLSLPDAKALLKYHHSSLKKAISTTSSMVHASHSDGVHEKPDHISVHPFVLVAQLDSISQHYFDGLQYIEEMIRQQLVAAIGKSLTPEDFAEYMEYHNNKKLFKEEFKPKAFSHAVRRPNHSPEGIISIEASDTKRLISTLVRTKPQTDDTANMSFALNAATTVQFRGPHYIHGWLDHQFSSSPNHMPQSMKHLDLVIRARQFSNFIVVLGKMKTASDFDAKHAVIVKNNDEFRVPLNLEQIPPPKVFKDLISSLSPEQQRFAKAFRNMQLEGSLFGITVIQIKPAMEKVLNLNDNALTKEIKLTQDLMTLFTEYQIPTDQLSFGGDPSLPGKDKLAEVRSHVTSIMKMIEGEKAVQVKAAQQKADYREAEAKDGVRRTKKSKLASPRFDKTAFRGAPGSPAVSASSASTATTPTFHSMSMSRGETADFVPEADLLVDTGAFELLDEVLEVEEMVMEVANDDGGAVRAREPERTDTKPADDNRELHADGEDTHPTGQKKSGGAKIDVRDHEDYTKIPVAFDRALEAFDSDGTVRPTLIKVGKVWNKRWQKSLLGGEQHATLLKSEQDKEKSQAFDLIDALSRSGGLVLESSDLHIIVAATHAFDKTLVNTVVEDNANPIEKVERTSLIMASTTHGKDPASLVHQQHAERVKTASPSLFKDEL